MAMADASLPQECPICYELLVMKGLAFYGGSCGHAFHVACLNSSVAAGNRSCCPFCRADWEPDRVIVIAQKHRPPRPPPPQTEGEVVLYPELPDPYDSDDRVFPGNGDVEYDAIGHAIGPRFQKIYDVVRPISLFVEFISILVCLQVYPDQLCRLKENVSACDALKYEEAQVAVVYVVSCVVSWTFRTSAAGASFQCVNKSIARRMRLPYGTVILCEAASLLFVRNRTGRSTLFYAIVKGFAAVFYTQCCYIQVTSGPRDRTAWERLTERAVGSFSVGMAVALILLANDLVLEIGIALAIIGAIIDLTALHSPPLSIRVHVLCFSVCSVCSALVAVATAVPFLRMQHVV